MIALMSIPSKQTQIHKQTDKRKRKRIQIYSCHSTDTGSSNDLIESFRMQSIFMCAVVVLAVVCIIKQQ